MAIAPWWIGGVLVANVVLGVLLMLGVFALMERQVSAGAVGGIVVGSGLVYAQATLGERMLDPTVQGMKLLVIAASLGAVVGVVGTVLVFEPEIGS